MNLEGRKIIVNKSSSELAEMLKNPQDYKDLMPDSLRILKREKTVSNSG
jgi:hypothetical protein